LLRKAASDLHDRSRADPKNTRVRDAARVLHAIDLALLLGDGKALDSLAAVVDQLARAKPGVDWGRSMSPRRASQRVLPRKKADAVTAGNRLRNAARIARDHMKAGLPRVEWFPELASKCSPDEMRDAIERRIRIHYSTWARIISTILGDGVVEWFPDLVAKRPPAEIRVYRENLRRAIERRIRIDGDKSDSELMVVDALHAFGMARAAASNWVRNRGPRQRPRAASA